MPENRKAYTIKEDEIGTVKVSEEVIASIAALAALEVKGVDSLRGNLTNEIKNYIGIKDLAQGISVDFSEEILVIDVALKIKYGFNIVEVSKAVQEKVKSAVENMTGIDVAEVNIKIGDVNIDIEE